MGGRAGVERVVHPTGGGVAAGGKDLGEGGPA